MNRLTHVRKTSSTWHGSCRAFDLKRTDGSDHLDNFRFS
jgi:hypothetical protein